MFNRLNHFLCHPLRWQRWLKDIYLDFKYGLQFLGGNISNGKPALGRSPSTSSDYDAIAIMFSKINLNSNDVLVDVGCGKGRVFNWALHSNFKNKMIGIEVDKKIAEFTRWRLKKFQQVNIVTADICDENVLPPQGTVFYLFNPFSAIIVKKFAEQMIKLKHKNVYPEHRPLILYYNCCHLDIFEQDPIWQIQKLGTITAMDLPAAIISFR